MGLFDRLLGRKTDDRDDVRPLWAEIVRVGRHINWYHCGGGVPDTLDGRFDVITAVLATVLLRMEGEPALIPASVRLTELFVEDMDGQLREIGVGDLVVGKHMGKLMSLLGGRLGAFRVALAEPDNALLEAAVSRNIALNHVDFAPYTATLLRSLQNELRTLDAARLLAASFARGEPWERTSP